MHEPVGAMRFEKQEQLTRQMRASCLLTQVIKIESSYSPGTILYMVSSEPTGPVVIEVKAYTSPSAS